MPSLSSRLRSAIDRDGAVILNIEGDTMLLLNRTGAWVWRRLQCGARTESIIQDLARETGADPAVVARDVHYFVGQLWEGNLLEL